MYSQKSLKFHENVDAGKEGPKGAQGRPGESKNGGKCVFVLEGLRFSLFPPTPKRGAQSHKNVSKTGAGNGKKCAPGGALERHQKKRADR